MRLPLILHPHSVCRAVDRIEVEVARPQPNALVLHYLVTGAIGDLRLPPLAAPVRADGLWRHSCFEAFLRAWPDAAYRELNFAPSTEWAAYHFSGYRSGMSVETEAGPPRIHIRSNGNCFELVAALELDGMPGLASNAIWRLGLSAVIEETSGRKSYWALAHPTGSPDFHHEDCFALQLPPAA
jgi:hypothetical protein